MPDILIKGMEMPKRCEDCMCYRREISHAYCTISSVCVLGHGNARLDNCPLVELPEHGDLIDRDEYRMSLNKTLIYENDIGKDEGIKIGLQKAYSRLVDAPVIVPAEREEPHD